jgi:hypothetical protein
MIKFFRKIRQKLLQEGKIANYMKYAIGEILLVVIGILIALQINNWNENKKSQAHTLVYIDRLIDDLIKDTLMVTGQIQAAKLRNKNSNEIYDIIHRKSEITDTSGFITKLQSIGRLDLPSTNYNTFNDLVNTGNMNLIRDIHITDAVKKYYSTIPEHWYKLYHDQLVNGYLPIAVDAIPMHLHEEIIINEFAYNGDYLDETLNNSVKNFTLEDVDNILAAITNNKDYHFQLKRITRSHLVHEKLLTRTKNNAAQLLHQLNVWRNKPVKE